MKGNGSHCSHQQTFSNEHKKDIIIYFINGSYNSSIRMLCQRGQTAMSMQANIGHIRWQKSRAGRMSQSSTRQ